MKWSSHGNRDLAVFQKEETWIIRNYAIQALLKFGAASLSTFKRLTRTSLKRRSHLSMSHGAGHPPDRGKSHFSQRLFGDHRCNFLNILFNWIVNVHQFATRGYFCFSINVFISMKKGLIVLGIWVGSRGKCTKVESFYHLDWAQTIVTSKQSKLESRV